MCADWLLVDVARGPSFELNVDDLMEPKVSVIIPSYNAVKFIARAIDSVMNQTVSDWELIVVDNESTDGTQGVVEGYGDDRIALHRIQNHGVIAASRNLGISAARAPWVAFLDADDWWAPGKLERCLAAGDRGADLVYHALRLVKAQTPQSREARIGSWQVRSPVFLDLVRRGNALCTSSVVVRRDILSKVSGFSEDPEMARSEDYNLWLRVSRTTERFTYLDEDLGCYLSHDGNASSGDMSGAFAAAVRPFMDELTPLDRRRLLEIVSYLDARHKYALGKYSQVRKEMLPLVLSARPVVRLKALARLLMSLRTDTEGVS